MEESTVDDAIKRGNVVVFFDITIGGVPAGRILMELFKGMAPRTVENFRQLCTGEYRRGGLPLGYKGVKFHRCIKDFMLQGGDIANGDGTGKLSIYGPTFADEPSGLRGKHVGPGILSMANSGPNSNACQFFITTAKADWLDGKHVVFGRLLNAESLLVVRKMEAIPTSGAPSNRPKIDIAIAECGEM